MQFEFTCATCGEIHLGMPSFGAEAPLSYFDIPENTRKTRCVLESDSCVIDNTSYFVYGLIEIPVHGEEDAFAWGVWVSLSESSFQQWRDCFHSKNRSQIGPFFGWLNAWLSPYPRTVNLKARIHLRDDGVRPYIELEPTDHPLAIEQRLGISVERVAEIYAQIMHAPG
jgi:hypothetical protein